MKLRISDYLCNIKEIQGAALSANLKCTCGACEFQFFHTGKQTKGFFTPFIVKKGHQLILKAICPYCSKSIIVYDSAKDGSNPDAQYSANEFVPLILKRVGKQFPIVIKYNYRPENFKIGEEYSNLFEMCYIYAVDKQGKEGIPLIEE